MRWEQTYCPTRFTILCLDHALPGSNSCNQAITLIDPRNLEKAMKSLPGIIEKFQALQD